MNQLKGLTLLLMGLVLASTAVLAQQEQVEKNAQLLAQKENKELTKAKKLAKEKGWPLTIVGKNNNKAYLKGTDATGMPLYITNFDIKSASTVGADKLWAGGSSGLNLSGSTSNLQGKVAMWEGGGTPLTNHVELNNRISIQESQPSTHYHATAVAGIIMAAGVNPLAKGMSYGLPQLLCYNAQNDESEMMAKSRSLLLSNHSYGILGGWIKDETNNRWYFLGRPSDNEDYKFGYYDFTALLYDSIAYNAPNYLITVAGGNARDEGSRGPEVGEPYYRLDKDGVPFNAGNRPEGISSNDTYDNITAGALAKNVLTVGAVFSLDNVDYSKPNDIAVSDFSSWGPTDDGRIKPDIVTNGVSVFTLSDGTVNSYDLASGTSTSAPVATGSLTLLQEYYAKLHPDTFLTAASLKALALHTAREAGRAPGPDYEFGWGLLDVAAAAEVIRGNGKTEMILEKTLGNNEKFTLPIIASGKGPVKVTICWTDPHGKTDTAQTALLNSRAPKLVNDLDLRIKKDAATYMPWRLNPADPAAAATKDDNKLDNVEQVVIADALPNEPYTIEINHKGSLARGRQPYSIIVTGAIAKPFCTSEPTNNATFKISNLAVGSTNINNTADCAKYALNNKNIINLEPGTSNALSLTFSHCDAAAAAKISKAYIDFNNDGDFDDANELLATSNAITGNGTATLNLAIGQNVSFGNKSILRIVTALTTNTGDIAPCGSYTQGTTQDYIINIVKPKINVSVTAFVSPLTGECPRSKQYITIKIQNRGSDFVKNVPISASVKENNQVVATLVGIYPDTIQAGSLVEYTLQTPIMLKDGQEYSIICKSSYPEDQKNNDDELVSSIIKPAKEQAPTGTAVVCSNTTVLTVAENFVNSYDVYKWYANATDYKPIAIGKEDTLNTALSKYYLSINEPDTTFSPKTKMVYPQGGYNNFEGTFIRFNALAPFTFNTARLYVGKSGKIDVLLYLMDGPTATTGYLVGGKTLDAYATSPTTPVLGAQNNNPADTGAIHYFGFDIPLAGAYLMQVFCRDSTSLYRNNEITGMNYPYINQGVMEITSNSAIDSTNPNLFQKYYYFFYDIDARPYFCPSDRVEIIPTSLAAPVITLANNTLTSTPGDTYQWYKDNVAIPNARLQEYKPTGNGNYHVTVTTTSGCDLKSNTINFTVTTPGPEPDPDPEPATEAGLKVLPNPTTKDNFNIQFVATTTSSIEIKITNAVGQLVYQYKELGFTGTVNKKIPSEKLAAGIYFVKVLHDNKTYIQKVLLTN